MAERELAILVTAKNLAGGVFRSVRGDIRGLSSEARRGAANIARNVGIASVAAAGIVATQVRAGLESLAELERVNAQTQAVLRSTNNAAGVSAENVREWAEELENLTTIDDKAIQNTENLLLTFTAIDNKAFKPALETILDMNAALGGDEDSLQSVVIQVGKALQDPIRGITALRRVGVNFSAQQVEQIKNLVEENRLFDAQQLILEELNKEFGGSAAAQADTYGGKMRRLADAVEEAQMALATAFLPVLERVSDRLQVALSDPDTLRAIEDFGGEVAEGFEQALAIAERLPWEAIGSTFSLMGEGAKAALELFLSAPPWLQTAVLTGWGLNKLSGGALGSIVGQLASGLIRGVLGINAGVVNINAAAVRGGLPGPGGGAGAGRGGITPAGALVAGAAGVGIGLAVGSEGFEENVAPAREFETEAFQNLLATGSAADIQRALDSIDEAVNGGGPIGALARLADAGESLITGQESLYDILAAQKEALEARLALLQQAGSRDSSAIAGRLGVLEGLDRQIVDKSTIIAGKDFSPTIPVTVNTAVSVYASASRLITAIQSQKAATGRGFQEF